MKKKSIPEVFIFYYFLICIIGWIVLLQLPKGDLELFINRHHFFWADLFFKTITHLGDGLVFLAIFPVLLLYRFSYAILCCFNASIHMIVSVILKQFVFPKTPRPAKFFEGVDLVQIQGVVMHDWHSFPSGHTATVFALATMIAMFYPKRHRFQVLILLIAVLAAFSRVYLMQHFLLDILVGSNLGLLSAFGARKLVRVHFKGKAFKRGLLPKRKLALSQLQPRPNKGRLQVKEVFSKIRNPNE